MSVKSNYVLQDIENPLDHDVLGGRGGASYRHQGNMTYRKLVQLNKPKYALCQKMEKMKISKSIVQAIRSQEPPGRFLEKDSKTGLWNDIGDKKAIEKTSQALREGQPDIRKNIEKLNANNLPIINVNNARANGVDSGVIPGPDMNSFAMSNNQRNAMIAPVTTMNHLAMGKGGIPAELSGSLTSLATNGTTQAVIDGLEFNPSNDNILQLNINQISFPNDILQSNLNQNQMPYSQPTHIPSMHQSVLDANKDNMPVNFKNTTLHAGAVNLLSHQYQTQSNNVNYGLNAHGMNSKKGYSLPDASVILASSNLKDKGNCSELCHRERRNRYDEEDDIPDIKNSHAAAAQTLRGQLMRERSSSRIMQDLIRSRSQAIRDEDEGSNIQKRISEEKVLRRSLSPKPRKSYADRRRTGILKKESSYSRKITEIDYRALLKKEKSQTSVGTFSIDSSVGDTPIRPSFFRELSARRRNENNGNLRRSMVSQLTDPFSMMDLDIEDEECDKLNEALEEDDEDDESSSSSNNQIKLVFGNDDEETEDMSKSQSHKITAKKLSSLDESADPWDKFSDKYSSSRRGSRSTRSSFLSTDLLTEFSAISEADESIGTMDFSAGSGLRIDSN